VPADGAVVVSVLVPCWNAETSIEGALASVLEERAVRLECVVVDDGSTDGTIAAVERVAAGDDRVVIVRSSTNEGVSKARNRALDVARGEWLTFLDADDRFFAGGIARLLGQARATDADAVIGQQIWSDGRRTWLSGFYDIPDIRVPGRKSLVANPGLLYYVSPHGKLFRRSLTEGLRFRGRVLGDQPWIIRALLRAGDRIEVIADTVYEWRRPGPGHEGPSITAATRSSARRGVEAAAIAADALALVEDEAARLLPDVASRKALATAYVDRLLRSDLGVHLANAIDRSDPTTGELLAAIEGFLETVRADILAGSTGLTHAILEPPLRGWSRLPRAGRNAYRSLLRTARRRSPQAVLRGGNAPIRLALRLAARPSSPVGDVVLAGLLSAGRGLRAVRRLARSRART